MTYSFYVHGWFLPWLDEQRENGKLTQGKTKVMSDGIEYDYEGEVDQDGKACGIGVANGTMRYEGTFFNGKAHGICKSTPCIPKI